MIELPRLKLLAEGKDSGVNVLFQALGDSMMSSETLDYVLEPIENDNVTGVKIVNKQKNWVEVSGFHSEADAKEYMEKRLQKLADGGDDVGTVTVTADFTPDKT